MQPSWGMSSKPQNLVLARLGISTLTTMLLALGVSACGSATRSAPPQSPSGTAALTGAQMGARFDRVIVAEKGTIAMVSREGCVATVAAGHDQTGDYEEMRVRCPKPERLKAWFSGVDQLTQSVGIERVKEDSDDDDVVLPAAELITKKGEVMKVTKREDAARLVGEVRSLAAELAAAETPNPGPSTEKGWQLLRVSGPAHVFLGGAPMAGVLDAKMSTNGQYLCEFVANTDDGPIRATKSGWVSPGAAAKAIDDVLSPLADVGNGDRGHATVAAGVANGAERRANAASTAAVFDRFSHVQDALGDACLPELDPPTANVGL